MAKNNADQIQKLRQLADDRGDRFRDDYSGRGMYGRTCVGITTDQPEDLIAEAGIKGARTDNMGKRTIVYWPELSIEKPKNEPENNRANPQPPVSP